VTLTDLMLRTVLGGHVSIRYHRRSVSSGSATTVFLSWRLMTRIIYTEVGYRLCFGPQRIGSFSESSHLI